MNERIQKLRELSVTTPVHIDLERAKIETDFYRENDGKYSIPVMRAMVLKEYFSKKTLYLGDGELIVGEKGKDPQASPTFPELCCHSVEDMTVMSERDLHPSTQQKKTENSRQKRSFRSGRKNYERETSGFHDSGMERLLRSRYVHRVYGAERTGTYMWWRTGIYNRISGLQREDQKTMDALDFMNDPDALDKMEELKAMDISCDAVIILGERYHELALELAEKEADPVRKEELKQIAANLRSYLHMHHRHTGRQSSYTGSHIWQLQQN